MTTHVLRMGAPPELEPKPPRGQQTKEARDRWVDHPGYGLVPQRVVSIFRTADRGYPQRQCDLFDDVVETDAHLRSQLETRRHAVAGKDWIIQAGGDSPEDRRAAGLLEEALRRAPSFASMIIHQLTAPWYGWAASEVIWGRDGDRYVPTWFMNVPHRRFIFDDQDEPLLVNDERGFVTSGVVLEPGRWIFGRMPGRIIAATGLLRTAARLSFAKRMCVRDATDGSARLGMPIPFAFYPIGYPEKEQEKALEAVKLIASGGRGYGAMGEGVKIEFLKADFGGSENFWVNLVSLFNSEISKLISGATLTSGEGTSSGSYALGAVHENVAYQIVKSDAKWLGDLFERDIGRPFCRFNGIDARPPRLKFHLVLQEDPTARVAVLQKFLEMGGKLDLDQVRQELAVKQVTGEALTGKAPPPPPPPPMPPPQSTPDAVTDEGRQAALALSRAQQSAAEAQAAASRTAAALAAAQTATTLANDAGLVLDEKQIRDRFDLAAPADGASALKGTKPLAAQVLAAARRGKE